MASLNRAAGGDYLDLTVPTDNRPFFFNQLRFTDVPEAARRALDRTLGGGVRRGNLTASAVLILILFISIVAVIATILVPCGARRANARGTWSLSAPCIFRSSAWASCLLKLRCWSASASISATRSILWACASSASFLPPVLAALRQTGSAGRAPQDSVWGAIVAVYLMMIAFLLPAIFQATTDQERIVRIAISLLAIMPLGFLLGFAFPTGMRLVEAIDRQPTPWFWGINGATGVLASVLGVMFGMAWGINVTLTISALCYLLLIPTSFALLGPVRAKKT